MVSNTITKAVLEKQLKTASDQTTESGHNRPSPLQIPKPTKSEPATPRRLPKSTYQNPAKHHASDIADQRPDHHRKGSIDALHGCIASKTIHCSELDNLHFPIENLKESLKRVDTPAIIENGGPTSLEGNGGQEKKISEQSSVKNSSVSSKVSDGTKVA